MAKSLSGALEVLEVQETNNIMAKKVSRRTRYLSNEEWEIYKKETFSKADYTKIKNTIHQQSDGVIVNLLCENKRTSPGAEQANYKDSGLALMGILFYGETLDDFIIHKLKMRNIIKKRVNVWNNLMTNMR